MSCTQPTPPQPTPLARLRLVYPTDATTARRAAVRQSLKALITNKHVFAGFIFVNKNFLEAKGTSEENL